MLSYPHSPTSLSVSSSSHHSLKSLPSFWTQQRREREALQKRLFSSSEEKNNNSNSEEKKNDKNNINDTKDHFLNKEILDALHTVKLEDSDSNSTKLKKLYDLHIYYVIEMLCRFEDLCSDWIGKIYNYAMRTNTVVEHDAMGMEFNDIRHYVKVKRLQGGKIEDCRFIDGVVFRHNVAHRKMRTNIVNPKILLLDCPIEYHRMNSKFHSFDILLKQVCFVLF